MKKLLSIILTTSFLALPVCNNCFATHTAPQSIVSTNDENINSEGLDQSRETDASIIKNVDDKKLKADLKKSAEEKKPKKSTSLEKITSKSRIAKAGTKKSTLSKLCGKAKDMTYNAVVEAFEGAIKGTALSPLVGFNPTLICCLALKQAIVSVLNDVSENFTEKRSSLTKFILRVAKEIAGISIASKVFPVDIYELCNNASESLQKVINYVFEKCEKIGV